MYAWTLTGVGFSEILLFLYFLENDGGVGYTINNSLKFNTLSRRDSDIKANNKKQV